MADTKESTSAATTASRSAAGTTESRSAAGPDKHAHHGRTGAAWAGSITALVAVILGGIAVMVQNWPLFWISAALLVLGLIAAKVLQVLGHGAN